jgi:hypothetical protein
MGPKTAPREYKEPIKEAGDEKKSQNVKGNCCLSNNLCKTKTETKKACRVYGVLARCLFSASLQRFFLLFRRLYGNGVNAFIK